MKFFAARESVFTRTHLPYRFLAFNVTTKRDEIFSTFRRYAGINKDNVSRVIFYLKNQRYRFEEGVDVLNKYFHSSMKGKSFMLKQAVRSVIRVGNLFSLSNGNRDGIKTIRSECCWSTKHGGGFWRWMLKLQMGFGVLTYAVKHIWLEYR